MKKYLSDYLKNLEKLLNDDDSDILYIKARHDEMIAYMQHERLVDLIVRMLTALADVIFISAFAVTENILMIPLCALLTILLVPYIFHYFFLENSVQLMYKYNDRICERMHNNADKSDNN